MNPSDLFRVRVNRSNASENSLLVLGRTVNSYSNSNDPQARQTNKAIFRFLKENPSINRYIRDQRTRATPSIPLNIAEDSSRFAKKEKRHLYIIARSSAMESVAAMDALADQEDLHEEVYQEFLDQYDSITQMLFRMTQAFTRE